MLTPVIIDQNLSKNTITLLNTSLNLFLRVDPAKVTMAQIAKASDLSKASLYKAFANKEEIYSAILLNHEGKFADILEELREVKNAQLFFEDWFNLASANMDMFLFIDTVKEQLQEIETPGIYLTKYRALKKQNHQLLNELLPGSGFEQGFVQVALTGLAKLYHQKQFQRTIDDRRGFLKYLRKIVSGLEQPK